MVNLGSSVTFYELNYYIFGTIGVSSLVRAKHRAKAHYHGSNPLKRSLTVKKTLFWLASLLLLTTVVVPPALLADGNPFPKGSGRLTQPGR